MIDSWNLRLLDDYLSMALVLWIQDTRRIPDRSTWFYCLIWIFIHVLYISSFYSLLKLHVPFKNCDFWQWVSFYLRPISLKYFDSYLIDLLLNGSCKLLHYWFPSYYLISLKFSFEMLHYLLDYAFREQFKNSFLAADLMTMLQS